MNFRWKVIAIILSLALMLGAGVLWRATEANRNQLRLAENASLCEVKAEQGSVQAQAQLGYMYSHGQGLQLDYSKALKWYRKAADQGDADGQYGVGYLYFHGQGVTQDDAEAVLWFRRAADQGSAKAQNALGLMYSQGQGVQQDYSEGVRWFRKAADQGYAGAEYNLGNMYYFGRGVTQDGAEAIRWYRMAADQKDEYAQRAISARLSIFGQFALLAQLLLGFWLFLDSLPVNTPLHTKSLPNFRKRVIIGLSGVLCSFSAVFNWYGYTHFKFLCFNCGFSYLNLLRWLLEAASLALLFYLVRPGTKSA